MLRILICCVVLGAAAAAATGQSIRISDWRTLSSLRTVRDAAAAPDGTLWVATSGGVFSVGSDQQVLEEYRNINALQSIDATAITVDPQSGVVIVGSGDGALDLRYPDGRWSNVTDIRRAGQYPRRGVRDLVASNGRLYIAADFGIAIFDLSNETFIETVDRIGSIQEKTRTNGIALLRDSIWVATDSGVVVAPLDVPTLRLPSVWVVTDTSQGLPEMSVPYLATNGQQIAAAAGTGAYRWDGARWVLHVAAPTPINGLSYDSELLVSTLNGIRSASGPLPADWQGELIGHTVASINGSARIIGFVRDKAIAIHDGTSVSLVAVNTPLSNQFARMAIDAKGGFWAATDVDPPRSGQGMSYYRDGSWSNLTAFSSPALPSNSCYRVSAFPDGRVVFGTWGGGVVMTNVNTEPLQLVTLNSGNSAMKGIATNPNYVLGADADIDRSGNIWIVNEQSAGQLLVNLGTGDPSATVGYPNCFDSRDNLYRALAVDLGNTKWVGSFNGSGLLAYNDRGTTSTSDDICQVVRSSNTQLPDNVISVLRVDRVGQLWIGTPKGVAVIAAPTSVTNSTIPFVRRISALTTVVVNDIYVDALNYKWVATTSGVYVLNEDGTEVLTVITKTNAPLADGNIRSVVVDDATGTVYLGTSFGCSVASTSSIRPETSFDLSIRPQPFRIETDGEVVIDGLATDADIRILTAGGFLVQALQVRGRQAVWDGRDVQGRLVPPGVYLVQASSAATGTSGVAKIMVRR